MKHVYLDQMHWLNLAKAELGRADGAEFVETLGIIRDAVRQQKLVFPLSFGHLMETAKAPKVRQRRALAALMAELSRGVVLRWSRPLIALQLRNSVRQMFSQPAIPVSISPFGRGVSEVFPVDVVSLLNLPPDRAFRFREYLNTPEAWIRLITFEEESWRLNGVESMRRTSQARVQDYERRRVRWAGQDIGFARRAYAVILTCSFRKELSEALQEIGHTLNDWGDRGCNNLMRFWESIPSVHIEMELVTQMHIQSSKAWKDNDDIDIGVLGLALPHCDAVFTERFWVDVVARRKLDKKYGTYVSYNLTELPKLVA